MAQTVVLEGMAIGYVGFNTASNVSLTATASPGTTVISSWVATGINTSYIIIIASVNLYNSATSAQTETLQIFVDGNYINVGTVTVPAGGYAQATFNYVVANPLPGQHNIGLAAYGASAGLTAEYAAMTAVVVTSSLP
ncbi:MAG: hypothetical protein RQ839_11500 [Thermoproteus sp.]|nr:hypothetical protein [Thermoproteus sp.]MDT7882873.1 hypothetical protein [Thermoproteus sp.]